MRHIYPYCKNRICLHRCFTRSVSSFVDRVAIYCIRIPDDWNLQHFCKKTCISEKRKHERYCNCLRFTDSTAICSSILRLIAYNISERCAILKSTDVFFVALIASLLFKMEKLTVKKLISCMIGFLGIIIMNLDGLSLQISPIGDGLVVLSVISYSFSVIMTKLFAQKEDPIILCGYQMTLGGTVMLLAGIILNGKIDMLGILPQALPFIVL